MVNAVIACAYRIIYLSSGLHYIDYLWESGTSSMTGGDPNKLVQVDE